MFNKLWHDSNERPKEKTYILIVHDYYNFGRDNTEMAYVKEDGSFVFKNLIHGCKWSDWAWKIKRWCYIDDILKIE